MDRATTCARAQNIGDHTSTVEVTTCDIYVRCWHLSTGLIGISRESRVATGGGYRESMIAVNLVVHT